MTFTYPFFCANSLFTFLILLVVSSQLNSQSDVEPPVGPSFQSVTNITHTSIDLSWPVATDNVGVVSYNIYQNSQLVQTIDANTFATTVSGLIPSTLYLFQVTSSDAAGNESNLNSGTRPITKHSTCGVTNSWVGNSGNWGDNHIDWSENAIANTCQDVVIDNGAVVTVPQTEIHSCTTLDVKLGSEFIVEAGAVFHTTHSQPGPHNIFGFYSYDIPGCSVTNGEKNCALLLSIFDSTFCSMLLGGDILFGGTYVISGDILTVSLDFLPLCPAFKIVDDNTLIRIGSSEEWSSL